MSASTRATSGLITRHRGGFPDGLTWILTEEEDAPGAGLDFGVHRMRPGEIVEAGDAAKEVAWVLMAGRAEVEVDGARVAVARGSLFDEAPTVVHAPAGARVRVEAAEATEWTVARATNAARFAPRIFLPADIQDELRGKGLAQDTAVRNVRLAFDATNRPEAALVVGEVLNWPGRWSSYPPHHHSQPEIYHYRFTLPQGYGHAELGDEVFKVRQFDTLRIQGGLDHPQAAAPGYGMYYLWIVRHLPGNPYHGFEFTEDHRWILEPGQQGWRPGGAGEH